MKVIRFWLVDCMSKAIDQLTWWHYLPTYIISTIAEILKGTIHGQVQFEDCWQYNTTGMRPVLAKYQFLPTNVLYSRTMHYITLVGENWSHASIPSYHESESSPFHIFSFTLQFVLPRVKINRRQNLEKRKGRVEECMDVASPIYKSLRTLFLIWTFFLYAGSYRVLHRFL